MSAARSATAGKSASTPQFDGGTRTILDLDQIQGNIVGFQKDFHTFLFLRFPEGQHAAVRAWLCGVIGDVATCTEVSAFNDLFKRIKNRRHDREDSASATRHGREDIIKATWLNLAFTYKGLQALGTNDPDLHKFPADFRQGMRHRAKCIGDVGCNAPEHWVFPRDGGDIHALILLAADSQADLDAEAGRQSVALSAAGIQLLFKQDGAARQEQPGHEHFGFKDGISQPGIVGLGDPSQDQKGQERVAAGEFVLGYPRQDAAPTGNATEPLPDLLMNGSYLVFRRLRQDVRSFRRFVREQADRLCLSEDLMGAKLVGRYRSGAPLEALNTKTYVPGANLPCIPAALVDPGLSHPALLEPENVNNFEYQDYDAAGHLVPRAAHIRKVYPRDQADPGEEVADAKRILRRGIPFGHSYREDIPDEEPEGGPAFPHDRGLLFLCYQNSIEDKFEFLQQAWVNNPAIPARITNNDPLPGQDPIIAQRDNPREFDIPDMRKGHHIHLLEQWVTTTGGDYFFSPSIKALSQLAKGPSQPLSLGSSLSMSTVGLKKGAVPMSAARGAGVCKIQITVAVQGVPPKASYPWRVWIRGKPVWYSNSFDELISNAEGIAVGSALVSVLLLIEALDRNVTAGDIIDRIAAGADPSTVLADYVDWEVEVITDKVAALTKIAKLARDVAIDSDQKAKQIEIFTSGNPMLAGAVNAAKVAASDAASKADDAEAASKIPPSGEWGWTGDAVGDVFPIDMGIHIP